MAMVYFRTTLNMILCGIVGLGFGCSNDDTENEQSSSSTTDDGIIDAPTWHQDIAPIVAGRCQGCHYAGSIAPFDFSTYEFTKNLGPAILPAIESGAMPPFAAQETELCQPPHPWKDDLRLSAEQKTLIRAWFDAGSPLGDPLTATALPQPPDLSLPTATDHVTIPSGVTVDGTTDRFTCYSVESPNLVPSFLNATQIRPGNANIVHHVLVFLDEEGNSAELAGEDGQYDCFGGPGVEGVSLLAAWAPGSVANRTPPGMGMHVPANSRLIINVHYHPTGLGPEVDNSTTLDIEWADPSTIHYAGRLALVGNFQGPIPEGGLLPGPNDPGSPQFIIPANAKNHTESMTYTLPDNGIPEYILWEVGTHMHYVGTDMRFTLDRPDGTSTCLIQTPRWDFNWQRGYQYDAPIELLPRARPGDTLGMYCTYDNSLDNPFVREALAEQGLDQPQDVVLGEETLDEMCLGILGIAYPINQLRENTPSWGNWKMPRQADEN